MNDLAWKYFLEEAKYELKLARQCKDYNDISGYNQHIMAAWAKFRKGTMVDNSDKELESLINYEMGKRSFKDAETQFEQIKKGEGVSDL